MTTDLHAKAFKLAQEDSSVFTDKEVRWRKQGRLTISDITYFGLVRLFNCEAKTDEADEIFNEKFKEFLINYQGLKDNERVALKIAVGRKLGLEGRRLGAIFKRVEDLLSALVVTRTYSDKRSYTTDKTDKFMAAIVKNKADLVHLQEAGNSEPEESLDINKLNTIFGDLGLDFNQEG